MSEKSIKKPSEAVKKAQDLLKKIKEEKRKKKLYDDMIRKLDMCTNEYEGLELEQRKVEEEKSINEEKGRDPIDEEKDKLDSLLDHLEIVESRSGVDADIDFDIDLDGLSDRLKITCKEKAEAREDFRIIDYLNDKPPARKSKEKSFKSIELLREKIEEFEIDEITQVEKKLPTT